LRVGPAQVYAECLAAALLGQHHLVQRRHAVAGPQSGAVRELSQPFASTSFGGDFAAAPASLRLAAAAAALAEHLRGSPYAQRWGLADVGALVAQLAADQPNSDQLPELRQMIERAAQLGA
ncbi:MAG: hypothetical protein WCI67_13840, partial [Chloroflexales bacterium]